MSEDVKQRDDGGSTGKELEKVGGNNDKPVKSSETPSPPPIEGEHGVSFGGAVDITGKNSAARFRAIAKGLWAGGIIAGIALAGALYLPASPERTTLIGLLHVTFGGILGTSVMHGRLADNREELARVRADLDRKSAECSKLQSKFLRNQQSSRPQQQKRGKKG